MTPPNVAPEASQRVLEAFPLDTQLLLALLDLKTERLLAECELVVTNNANIEAQMAAHLDSKERDCG